MPGEQIEKSNLKSQAELSNEHTLPDQLGIRHRRKESVWNKGELNQGDRRSCPRFKAPERHPSKTV